MTMLIWNSKAKKLKAILRRNSWTSKSSSFRPKSLKPIFKLTSSTKTDIDTKEFFKIKRNKILIDKILRHSIKSD
jgi:hypothetical protein